MFEDLEAWCRQHHVAYLRWSGGYGGEWNAERVVFDGANEPRHFDADEDDNRILVDRTTIERLGTMEAIIGFFDTADFVLPPLVVEDQPLEP